MPIKQFKHAKCFQDLVESNIHFINNELSKTPVHNGPLDTESNLIKDKLLELCTKYNILTQCSQPSIINDICMQRGYVEGAVACNIELFYEHLKKSNLEFVITQQNKMYKNISITKYGRWPLSVVELHGNNDENMITIINNKKWYARTGIWANDLADIICEYKLYNTKKYRLTEDMNIIFFVVCDKEYNNEHTRCCSELINILNIINNSLN